MTESSNTPISKVRRTLSRGTRDGQATTLSAGIARREGARAAREVAAVRPAEIVELLPDLVSALVVEMDQEQSSTVTGLYEQPLRSREAKRDLMQAIQFVLIGNRRDSLKNAVDDWSTFCEPLEECLESDDRELTASTVCALSQLVLVAPRVVIDRMSSQDVCHDLLTALRVDEVDTTSESRQYTRGAIRLLGMCTWFLPETVTDTARETILAYGRSVQQGDDAYAAGWAEIAYRGVIQSASGEDGTAADRRCSVETASGEALLPSEIRPGHRSPLGPSVVSHLTSDVFPAGDLRTIERVRFIRDLAISGIIERPDDPPRATPLVQVEECTPTEKAVTTLGLGQLLEAELMDVPPALIRAGIEALLTELDAIHRDTILEAYIDAGVTGSLDHRVLDALTTGLIDAAVPSTKATESATGAAEWLARLKNADLYNGVIDTATILPIFHSLTPEADAFETIRILVEGDLLDSSSLLLPAIEIDLNTLSQDCRQEWCRLLCALICHTDRIDSDIADTILEIIRQHTIDAVDDPTWFRVLTALCDGSPEWDTDLPLEDILEHGLASDNRRVRYEAARAVESLVAEQILGTPSASLVDTLRHRLEHDESPVCGVAASALRQLCAHCTDSLPAEALSSRLGAVIAEQTDYTRVEAALTLQSLVDQTTVSPSLALEHIGFFEDIQDTETALPSVLLPVNSSVTPIILKMTKAAVGPSDKRRAPIKRMVMQYLTEYPVVGESRLQAVDTIASI